MPIKKQPKYVNSTKILTSIPPSHMSLTVGELLTIEDQEKQNKFKSLYSLYKSLRKY